MLTYLSKCWESQLLALATEAFEHHRVVEPVSPDHEGLPSAYAACEAITRNHSRTFYLASSLLPPEKRRAVRALYAFCRVSDDLVDRAGEPGTAQRLEAWRERALSSNPPGDDLVALAWADTRARYHIPAAYTEQLIDGVKRDLFQCRYETFEELSTYCYGVASTVGLMSMHIIGYSGLEALPYALKLGVALQLTNILRDVGEDWRNGRLYLPLEELREFGLSEADVAAGCLDDRWQAFIRFQIHRNRQLYADSLPGIARLSPDGRFAIEAAAELYQGILEDIERHQGNVFNRRASLSTWDKLARLPGIWWRARNHPPAEQPAIPPHSVDKNDFLA